jgi:hypothetical protein
MRHIRHDLTHCVVDFGKPGQSAFSVRIPVQDNQVISAAQILNGLQLGRDRLAGRRREPIYVGIGDHRAVAMPRHYTPDVVSDSAVTGSFANEQNP